MGLGGGEIRRAENAALTQNPKVEFRLPQTLVGGACEPAARLGIIPRHASGLQVENPQVELRRSVALFGGAMVPQQGPHRVFAHPAAALIKNG